MGSPGGGAYPIASMNGRRPPTGWPVGLPTSSIRKFYDFDLQTI